MKLEHQVCSFELAKRLHDLGVKQDSVFVWECFNDSWHAVRFVPYAVVPDQHNKFKLYSAFTVAELGEMIFPFNIVILKYKNEKNYVYEIMIQDIAVHRFYSENEADACAKMLIYLIENGVIKL